jgi:SpoVK/Ycf46/Vps4 family AAA+-type ATPase
MYLLSVSIAELLSVSIAELMRSDVGESEKFLVNLFAQARARAPCLLFFDEFQAIFGHGRHESGSWGSKMISQFLLEFDRLGTLSARTVDRPPVPSSAGRGADGEVPLVLVIAATNAPDSIDTALLRPGRFDNIIYVGLPDDDGRREILQAVRARMSQRAARTRVLATHRTAGDKACDLWHLSEDAWTELVQATHGYSGWSHVMIVCCSCSPPVKKEPLIVLRAVCNHFPLSCCCCNVEFQSTLSQVLIWRSCVMPLASKQ